jgi:integrase
MQKLKSKPPKRQGRGRKGEGSLKLRGGVYWYKIPDPKGGKPLERSCGTSDLNEAIRVKAKALMDLLDPARQTVPCAQSVTIAQVLADYLAERNQEADYRARNDPDYDPKFSLSGLRGAISMLTRHLGKIKATELASQDLVHYRKLRERKVSFSTVNHDLAYLRAAMNRGTKQTPPTVLHVPYMWMPSTKSCVREGFIERTEGGGYHEILKALPDALKAIHVCAFHVGSRRGELLKLRWEMVKWERDVIELRPKTTKTGDGRTIPIWGDMRQWLQWQKQIRDRDFPKCEWVFFWHRGCGSQASAGGRLSGFSRQYKLAAIEAGFPKAIFHDLRRSGIKYAIQDADIDSTVVRHMSGHKTDSMLQRYNIQSTREMENLGRALDASLNRKRAPVVAISQPAVSQAS